MPSTSVYWNSMDFDSEESDSQCDSPSSPRNYVDPWDLENYAYMRRHVASTPEQNASTPSPAGESADSMFYYVPGSREGKNRRSSQSGGGYSVSRNPEHHSESIYDSVARKRHRNSVLLDDTLVPGRFAQIDEQDFRNDYIRFEVPNYDQNYHSKHNEQAYSYYDRVPHSAEESHVYSRKYDHEDIIYLPEEYEEEQYQPFSDVGSSECEDYPQEGSLLYMYETTSRRRSMAVPPPPSQNYDDYEPYCGDYYLTNQIIYSGNERSSMYKEPESSIYGKIKESGVQEHSIYGRVNEISKQPRNAPIPIYDDSYAKVSCKPENFGLSNYGHLKIDYSCSWNSLDRFIGK